MEQDKAPDQNLPDSFDHKQPDLPTLAVDPDPDEVTEEGQQPAKYPAAGAQTQTPAPRAGGATGAEHDEPEADA